MFFILAVSWWYVWLWYFSWWETCRYNDSKSSLSDGSIMNGYSDSDLLLSCLLFIHLHSYCTRPRILDVICDSGTEQFPSTNDRHWMTGEGKKPRITEEFGYFADNRWASQDINLSRNDEHNYEKVCITYQETIRENKKKKLHHQPCLSRSFHTALPNSIITHATLENVAVYL